MNDLYKTIQASSEGIYKEKGSKFLAFAYPVGTETMIKNQIADLKKQYHGARHHCFAWRLGPEKDLYRVNDDGEPSGSAGNPIFGQIQSRDLTNVLVVVVRYFGGALLGVGGLINAYRSSASDALDRTPIVDLKVYSRLNLEFGYNRINAVMKVVKEFQLGFETREFDLNCSLTLKVWIRKENQVMERLSNIDGCKITALD